MMSNHNRPVLRISTAPANHPCLLRYSLGTPLLALGVFAAVASVVGMRGVAVPPHMGVPLGIAFAGTGAYLLFARRGATLDKRHNTVKTWWGLLIPFHHTAACTTDECTNVTITSELRSTSQSSSSGSSTRSTYTVYAVRLKQHEGKPVLIAESRRYLASRRNAEAVAKFLNLGITDRTSGTTVVREAGTLDVSLAERLRVSGEEIKLPARPGTCRSKLDVQGEAAAFTIPAASFGLME